MFKRKPSREYRFFLYDSEGEGMIYFQSAEQRNAFANEALATYRDMFDGWSDEAEFMTRGEVTEFPQVLDKKLRPPAHELDENQCDAEGLGWPDGVEWYGNYTWEACDVEAR